MNRPRSRLLLRLAIVYVPPLLIISTLIYNPIGTKTLWKQYVSFQFQEISRSRKPIPAQLDIKNKMINQEPLLSLLKIPGEFFDYQFCVTSRTYLGNYMHALAKWDIQIRKINIMENGVEITIQPNEYKCFRSAKEFEVEDFTQEFQDEIAKQKNLVVFSEAIFTSEPIYKSLPILLYFTVYSLWWTLILLWNKAHQFAIQVSW